MLHIDFLFFSLKDINLNAWFGGMYQSFFDALERAGVKVTLSKNAPDLAADVLVVPLGSGQDSWSARAINAFKKPVILYAPPATEWFRHNFLERWGEYILFAYGNDFSEFTPKLYEALNIKYYHLALASDPTVMRPLGLPKVYDVVFVGSVWSAPERRKYFEALMNVAHNRKILLLGIGWEQYGFPYQCVAWGDLLNIIYNTATVCVNIFNDGQKAGVHKRLDVNNRLFDLAMAGCFQISNAPETVRHYFDASEVLAFDTIGEWVSAIMYYVDHPAETTSYQIAARRRALSENTWDHRAKDFLAMVETQLKEWQPGIKRSSLLQRVTRQWDMVIPSNHITTTMWRGASFLLRNLQRLTDAK